MRFGYPNDPLTDFGVGVGSIAKLLPIIKPTASDYVVYGCKGPLRMVQMTVLHAFWIIAAWT